MRLVLLQSLYCLISFDSVASLLGNFKTLSWSLAQTTFLQMMKLYLKKVKQLGHN